MRTKIPHHGLVHGHILYLLNQALGCAVDLVKQHPHLPKWIGQILVLRRREVREGGHGPEGIPGHCLLDSGVLEVDPVLLPHLLLHNGHVPRHVHDGHAGQDAVLGNVGHFLHGPLPSAVQPGLDYQLKKKSIEVPYLLCIQKFDLHKWSPNYKQYKY